MKKFNIRKQIAALLSASMVFAMLAPALPVYAEVPGKINFSFSAWQPSIKSNRDFSIQGPPLETISGDTDTDLNADNRIYMPFYDKNIPGYSNTKTFKGKKFLKDENSVSDSVGYKLVGWYSSKENRKYDFKTELLPSHYPASEITYYGVLEADTSKSFKTKIEHVADGTETVPGLTGQNIDSSKKVLEEFQAIPLSIPGYKVANQNLADTLTSYASNGESTSDFNTAKDLPTNDNFKFNSGSKYVTGTMVNRNIKVVYKYKSDHDTKFSLNLVYKIEDLQGNITTSNDTTYREYYAGQNLTVENIGPKADFSVTDPISHQSRYTLESKNIYSASGTDQAPQVASNLLTADKIGFDANNKITGVMLNQNLKVVYKYKLNNNYYTSLRIKYVDDDGVNITDKVVAKLGAQVADSITSPDYLNSTKPYKNAANELEYRVKVQNADYIAFAPVLDEYVKTGTQMPSLSPDDATAFSNAGYTIDPAAWAESNPQFKITAANPSNSGVVTVKYTKDPDLFLQVNLSYGQGGKIVQKDNEAIDYDPINNPSQQIKIIKTNKTSTGFTLEIPNGVLHTPKPDAGYTFAQWLYINKLGVMTPITIPWTHNFQNSDIQGSTITLRAAFVKKPSDWTKITLEEADPSKVSIDSVKIIELLNKNTDGTPKTLKWGDISGDIQITNHNPSAYNVQWMRKNSLVVMNDPNQEITEGTYVVYAIPNTPNPSAYQPQAAGEIDAAAIPAINVDQTNPAPVDVRLNYVITDLQGKVIKVVSGGDVLSGNGKISGYEDDGHGHSGFFIHPGEKYNLYTVPSNEIVNPGQDISTVTSASAGTEVSIPHVYNPMVVEDSAHRGKAAIKVDPTTKAHQYALLDDAGNVVKTFTSPNPDGGALTFDNLELDKNYYIVVRPVGDNTPETAKGPGQLVNTSNITINKSTYEVKVAVPAGVNIQLDPGNPDLSAVRPGSSVQITVDPQDANGNFFSEFAAINGIGNTALNKAGQSVQFIMPANEVKLQAVYESASKWTDPSQFDNSAHDGREIGVVKPTELIPDSEAGPENRFRLHIYKTPMPNDTKQLIQVDEGIGYKGLWVMRVVVEYTHDGTNWIVYGGDVPELTASIDTGALVPGNKYVMHKLDDLHAASAVLEDGLESLEDRDNYSGMFDKKVENGVYYAFGYSSTPSRRVDIRSSRTDVWKTAVVLRDGESLADHSSEYSSFISGDEGVDLEGITWTYRGISSTKAALTLVDEADKTPLDSDKVYYLYYSDDKTERAKAYDDLVKRIASAKQLFRRGLTENNKGLLEVALASATALINKTDPRKATTSELLAELNYLNGVVDSVTGGSSGGGGGSGGGSGGGGGGSRGIIADNSSVRVGYDGSWKLVDSANHIWNFNLSSGSKLKGWARLSYTYDGVTRTGWYHFNDDGVMDSGWYHEASNNTWYYLSENHDGFFGEMKTGWHFNSNDNKWYYLKPADGSMSVDWSSIGEKWYYFTKDADEKHSYGSLYMNETTPDGYNVDSSGVIN